jgi:ABC-type transporter Mla maintaining outer membrane lipid asymmetry permease subunit MlaE
VEQVGQVTVELIGEVRSVLDFLGDLAASTWHSLRHPKSINGRDIALTMERAGADAVPIVLLINFLIGFVMAYQGALQLEQFGASIFVADLVGLSVTRELAPLMTAIIVCGRTGAAFAAELGTMKVSEEVDALRTLGFLPMRYLVIPRVVGLLLVAPLLTLLADAVGILGGLVVGALTLDITPRACPSRDHHDGQRCEGRRGCGSGRIGHHRWGRRRRTRGGRLRGKPRRRVDGGTDDGSAPRLGSAPGAHRRWTRGRGCDRPAPAPAPPGQRTRACASGVCNARPLAGTRTYRRAFLCGRRGTMARGAMGGIPTAASVLSP